MSIVLAWTTVSGVYIVHPSPRGPVRVLQVDPFTGAVSLLAEAHETEDAALLALASFGDVVTQKRRVTAVLGLAVVGATALLFVAVKTREVGLPGGVAHVVVQADVVEIPVLLPRRDDPDGALAREAQVLAKYPFAEVSFYSTTLDLSRPFGPPVDAVCAAAGVANEFVWNDALRHPFVTAGCGELCPPLIQGYCARRRVDSLRCAIITRCSMRNPSPVSESDLVVWSDDRMASFTVRQSTAPQSRSQDAVTSYFEELAERVRGPDLLLEPMVCMLTLEPHEEEALSAALTATRAVTSRIGNTCHLDFDWDRSCKLHGGKAEGAAGESYNVVGECVRRFQCTIMVERLSRVACKQNALLVLLSRASLKPVSEFALFFSVVVAAELVRLVQERVGEPAWQGLSCAPAQLRESFVPPALAQHVASLSVEASDALTYLFLWRESLFAGSEVGSLLPNSMRNGIEEDVLRALLAHLFVLFFFKSSLLHCTDW